MCKLILAGVACFVTANVSQAATEQTEHNHSGWFYVVKSKPSEPAHDAEFNRWYDEIDIPDVLEVPGFVRARRGRVSLPKDLEPDRPNYVALYDIVTDDIDKSIIDLYVAARKMGRLGRLTDLLQVVEANYYRRLSVADGHDTRELMSTVLTQKVLCCDSASDRDRFLAWYDTSFEPALAKQTTVGSVELHELYRVMEVLALEPAEIPHFLIVVEASAAFGAAYDAALQGLPEGRGSKLHIAGERLVYEILREWRAE